MFNEYPYTSYEKINLDWLLDLGNKLKADAESGEFDGYSPTIHVEDIQGGYRLTIIDKNGEQSIDIINGQGGGGVVDSALSTTSINPVQNRVLTNALNTKYVKPSGGIPASDLAAGVIPTVPTKTSELTNDSGFLTPATLPIYNGGVS